METRKKLDDIISKGNYPHSQEDLPIVRSLTRQLNINDRMFAELKELVDSYDESEHPIIAEVKMIIRSEGPSGKYSAEE